MRCRGWRTVVVLGLLLSFGRARDAGAADPTAADRARRAALLRTGTAAAASKDWQGCVDALTAALAIEKDAKVAGQLGLCDEGAGRLVDAYDHLKVALDATSPDQSSRQPWASYHDGMRRVMARVALVIVTANPPDTYVLVDGRPLGRADGRMFAVLPGKHVVTARRPGYQDASDPRTLRGGDVPTFDFLMKPAPTSTAAVVEPTAAPAKTAAPMASGSSVAAARPSWWTPLVPSLSARGAGAILAYSTATVALVATGLTVGLEVDRASMARGHAADHCTGATTPFCAELHERREQRNIAGGVAIGAGIFAVSTGLAVVLADVYRGRASGVVAPVVGKDGGGLVVRGAW